MIQPFSDQHKEIADGMGVSLYQKLSLDEASSFLGCSQDQLKTWSEIGDIECIQLPAGNVQFFGYQLVSYLISYSTPQPLEKLPESAPDRILRSPEVQDMVGLSRQSIWRYEKYGKFPKRIKLGDISVGWKLSEVQQWISER